eukprot:6024443-Pleurochrysis_carterae.AAC.2
MAAREFDNEVATDKNDLSVHREARRQREELAREDGVAKLTEGYTLTPCTTSRSGGHQRKGRRRRRRTQSWAS